MQIRRCRHVKVNGEQCGSPALRGKCHCYFHHKYNHLGAYGVKPRGQRNAFDGRFPVLEDGNSIQAAVMQVIRLILAKEIDTKEAGLLLYALQLASSNLKQLQVAPSYDEIVIDPLLVRYSPIRGKPTREEQRKVETEDEQKERDALEQQIKHSQEQADEEWENEVRQEFEGVPDNSAVPEPCSSTPVSGPSVIPSSIEQNANEGSSVAPPFRRPAGETPAAQGNGGSAAPLHCFASPELIHKIQDAAARYQKYPADRELREAYAALTQALQPIAAKNKS